MIKSKYLPRLQLWRGSKRKTLLEESRKWQQEGQELWKSGELWGGGQKMAGKGGMEKVRLAEEKDDSRR